MAAAPSPASGSHFSPDAWYFTKEELRHSPSVRDGYTAQQETKERRAVCAFMQETGKKLQLPQLSIATGIVFFHRFFALHSFKDYDGYIIGISCLFLAAKVEETPKKLRDVLLHSDAVRNEGTGKEPLSPTSNDYTWLKDQVLQGERAVLQTMAFELTIDHPYKYVLNYVKTFRGNLNDKQTKEVAQITWNFVNDSLRTTLCLEYRPQLIAAAALLLAARKHAADHNLPIHLPDVANAKGVMVPWYESLDLGIALADLEDCSAQIRDLYDGLFLGSQLGKTPDSGSGAPASSSAGTTPTPISPSPGSVTTHTISPVAPAAASALARRDKEPKDAQPQAHSQPSGTAPRPAGTRTVEPPTSGDRKSTGQSSPPHLTPGGSVDGGAAKAEDGKDKDAAARDKERKDASREKRTHLKQEERNERKFRPY